MRAAALVFLLLPACVFLPRPRTDEAPPPPEVNVDYSGMYGAKATRSLWRSEFVQPGLVDRLVLEPEAVSPWGEAPAVEPWTLQMLLARLDQLGAMPLLGKPKVPPPPMPRPDEKAGKGKVEEPPPAPPGPPPATAAFHRLRFLSGVDDFAAVVEESGPASLRIRRREGPDEASLCGRDFSLPVGYAVFQGALNRLPSAELVAVVDELQVVAAPEQARLALVLPPADDPAFCGLLRDAFLDDEGMEPRDADFVEAANTVLESALGLLPKP